MSQLDILFTKLSNKHHNFTFHMGKHLVNKYLLSLLVLLPFSTNLLAQEDEEKAEEAAVEEVVVTNIKSS